MKRRFLLLTLLILGIGIGIAVSRSGLVSRTGPQPAAAEAELMSSVPLQADVVTSGSEADQLVQELNSRSVSNLRAMWAHVQQNVKGDTDSSNNGILPNGKAIPSAQVNDIWYHVDDLGYVTEVISVMRTVDGEIIQVGVCNDKTCWNSATDEESPWERFVLNGFGYGFLKNDLQWLESFGNTATVADIVFSDGSKGIEVVIGAKYEQPAKTNEYIQPSIQSETRAVFDSITGHLVSRNVTVWLLDGSQRVLSSMTQKVALESPTEEILNFLAEKNKR